MWMTFNHRKTYCTKLAHFRLKIRKVIEFFYFQSLMQHPHTDNPCRNLLRKFYFLYMCSHSAFTKEIVLLDIVTHLTRNAVILITVQGHIRQECQSVSPCVLVFPFFFPLPPITMLCHLGKQLYRLEFSQVHYRLSKLIS